MAAQITAWESTLLARARFALRTPAAEPMAREELGLLDEAYQYCARVTKVNSRTFYLATALLPHAKRRAVRALYAFCRATDDLIDQVPRLDDASNPLETWQSRLSACPTPYDPILLAWADTKARHQIPSGLETQLLEGVARDLSPRRYTSFAELAEYCYGVASTVGLMVMHIVDFADASALPYAVRLGVALQLTNILRDVGADWRSGRLYLPLDDLGRFGLTEDDVANGCVDDRWRAFMRFQIARARGLFERAEPGIALLDPDGRFAIAAASELYRGILDRIEAFDFEVFRARAHLGTWEKIARLPRIWWHARTVASPAPMPESARTGEAEGGA